MLRKIIYLLLFEAMLLHHYASAQGFRAGLTTAFVASDVYGADVVPDGDAWNNTDFHKTGFMLGGAVSRAIGKRSTLELEINYIEKGTKQPADSAGNGYYNYSFNYVEIPLVYKYRLHISSGSKDINGFEISAGASFGKMVHCKQETTDLTTINDYTYLNTTDISLLAGLGYNFNEHFNFSFRYSNGVIPVFKNDSNSPVYLNSSFNTGNSLVLQFILQYMFGKGPRISSPLNTNDE